MRNCLHKTFVFVFRYQEASRAVFCFRTLRALAEYWAEMRKLEIERSNRVHDE